MSQSCSIEWTQSSWNPVTGCTKVSPGCQHCYAERMSRRLKAMGHPNYSRGFQVTCHPHMLRLPFEWKKPQVVFVNSMSDLFHPEVPDSYIEAVFDVMNTAMQHNFQILTKRTERLLGLSHRLRWTDNIWMGVTVESSEYLHRIQDLRATGAHIKFAFIGTSIGAD